MGNDPAILDGERWRARSGPSSPSASPCWPPRACRSGLGTVLVGDDVPAARYVALKHEDCARSASTRSDVHLPADATQDEVMRSARSTRTPRVDAFLVQVPLPGGPRRGGVAVRRRPRQGRRRAAPGEPRPAHARHACPAALHAGGHRRAARTPTRSRRGPPCRRHRPRAHHRTPVGHALTLKRPG